MAKNGKAGFEKFVVKKNNAAVKEKFKQEKKQAKKDKAKAIEEHFERKRALKQAGSGITSITDKDWADSKRLLSKNKYTTSINSSSKPSFKKDNTSSKVNKPNEKEFSKKTFTKEFSSKPSFKKAETNDIKEDKFFTKKTASSKPFFDKPTFSKDKKNDIKEDKNFTKKTASSKPFFDKPSFSKINKNDDSINKFPKKNHSAPIQEKQSVTKKDYNKLLVKNEMPLNKFLAHAGISSRREAVTIIKEGKVMVNNNIVTEPATKVSEADIILLNGKKLNPTKNRVYILLNKPKDCITTVSDPEGRKTVIDLVQHATKERIYPVGRLDRNTSGVLLITNDGDLAQHLSHPKNNVKKIYHVILDKPLTKAHFDEVINGVLLEDGVAHVDALAHPDVKFKNEVGIEIHSGKNRIVRRIFESLGYDIKSLDRVFYAGLTKKNVDRGKWRFLNDKEIRNLKFFTKA